MENMKTNLATIKVKNKAGNWCNNAFVENISDAIRIAKFYRDELGYSVQLWKKEKDISFLLDSD